MIEKIKAVNNPLTIIAIFAALAEIAGTVALGVVETSNQSTFIWFVMLFPTLIVLLFFGTLNFNPSVLYAPSDFKDEANFIQAIRERRLIRDEFKSINAQIEETKNEIVADVTHELGDIKSPDQSRLKAIIDQLATIQHKIETTSDKAIIAIDAVPRSNFQARILAYIAESDHPVTMADIQSATGTKTDATKRALTRMVERGLIYEIQGAFALKVPI